MEGDRERCLEAGMEDHLTKPFSRANLVEMIERWVSSRSADPTREQGETMLEDVSEESIAADVGESPPLDAAALDQLAAIPGAGASGLVTRVVSLYLETSYPIGAVIRKAAELSDAEALASSAHRLKSSNAEVGAMRLAELCKDLEVRGRTNALDGAAALASELEHELERVRQALESRIA
jgi:CheY-like chemotaxis protein